MTGYPGSSAARRAWITERRGERNRLDPWRPYGCFNEEEPGLAGGPNRTVATLLLTNTECPWRCLMCDLWKNTLEEPTPAGAIPEQIRWGLERLDPARDVKLYNAGSFFDPRAIPMADHPAIADAVGGFERVVVECHPSLVGPAVAAFDELLEGQLEVAMGLETVDPPTLARLNKGTDLEGFARAARELGRMGVPLRVFVMLRPPFQTEEEGVHHARRSVSWAFDHGAETVVIIPTRGGNGAMEALAAQGDFSPPERASMEAVLSFGRSLGRGRVMADAWSGDDGGSGDEPGD